MFPEIMRDDVFRLETRRMWLRWPEVGDAAAIGAIASQAAVADMTMHVPHPYPAAAAQRQVEHWRAMNTGGQGLWLALTLQGDDRTPIGIAGLEPGSAGLKVGLIVHPDRWSQGFGTEAVQALIDAAFTFSAVTSLEASVRVINPGARRLFERCGFAYEATVLREAPARGGMVPCDCFRLDRKLWRSFKQWRMPTLDPRRDPVAPRTGPASTAPPEPGVTIAGAALRSLPDEGPARPESLSRCD